MHDQMWGGQSGHVDGCRSDQAEPWPPTPCLLQVLLKSSSWNYHATCALQFRVAQSSGPAVPVYFTHTNCQNNTLGGMVQD